MRNVLMRLLVYVPFSVSPELKQLKSLQRELNKKAGIATAEAAGSFISVDTNPIFHPLRRGGAMNCGPTGSGTFRAITSSISCKSAADNDQP